jgi:hypothetical protein
MIILQEQRGLGLGSGEAELTRVVRQSPCCVVLPQCLQTFGNVGFVNPFDFIFSATAQGVQAIGRHELNGAGTIFADMRDQGKNIARRNLERRGPARQHTLIVRQEAP